MYTNHGEYIRHTSLDTYRSPPAGGAGGNNSDLGGAGGLEDGERRLVFLVLSYSIY